MPLTMPGEVMSEGAAGQKGLGSYKLFSATACHRSRNEAEVLEIS